MKLALPIWNERISPVFDVAQRLMVVDVDGPTEVNRQELSIDETKLASRAQRVAELGVNVLICGAISWPLETMLVSAGIRVVPQTCGAVEDVLRAFVSGQLTEQAFLIPGCCGRRRRFHGQYSHNWPRHDIYGGILMKIAITVTEPNLEADIDPRFGRCAYFLVVDTDTLEFEAIENPNKSLGSGAGIQSAQLLAEKDVRVVLTGNCGPNAQQTLSAAGIGVVVGCSGSGKAVIEKFKAGQLETVGEPNVASRSGMADASPSPVDQQPSPGAGMGMGPGQQRGQAGGMGRGRGRGQGRGMGRGPGGGRGMGRGG